MNTLFCTRHDLPRNSTALLLAFCFLLFTNVQCKKGKLPIDRLPAATQTGANTFGCLVNGEAVTPTITFIYNNNFNYGYDPSYGLSIDVNNKDNQDYLSNVEINLRIPNLTEGQTYLLTDYNVAGKGGAQYNRFSNLGNPTDYYETNSQTGGSVTITKCDLSKKIISGTFSFKAAKKVNGSVANVTDGRFDLTFK